MPDQEMLPGELSQKIDAEELQHIANYYCANKKLRRSAVVSILWGIVNGFIAYAIMEECHFKVDDMLAGVIVAAIACYQVASGIWLFLSPSALGLIAEAIGLLLVGLLNFVFSLGTRDITWAIVGIVQIFNAFIDLRSYKRHRNILSIHPNGKHLEFVKNLIKKIKKQKFSQNSNAIHFQTNTKSGRHKWKGWLMDHHGIFVDVYGHHLENKRSPEVFVANREDVEIVKKKKSFFGKNYRIDVFIRDHIMHGSIHQKSLERYEHWKQGDY